MIQRRPRPGWLAGVVSLPLLAACASPLPPVETPPPEPLPTLSDIHRCLTQSRRPVSEAVDSGMVVPSRYNACMRARGWRSEAPKPDAAG